jgi:undecaprenyl-diphosphatase
MICSYKIFCVGYNGKVWRGVMLEILKAALLGIIEGITEWLPISSTGHMILVEEFIKLNVSENFMKMFRVVIQLGAILAVIILYFQKLNPFSSKKSSLEKKNTMSIWYKVIIGVIPAYCLMIGLMNIFIII